MPLENIDDQPGEMEMEVFASGNWNGDEFTDSHLQDLVANFNELRDSVKPFLKLGGVDPHADVVHQPAIGWVDSLRIADGKLIASVKDIPKIVFEAIKRKLYRRVSSEIYQNYKQQGKTYGLVLRAVALLGAAVPAVSTLKDLTTYLTQTGESDAVLAFSEVKFFPKEEKKMPDVDIKVYEEQVTAAKAAEAAAKAEAETAKAQLKTFQEEQVAKAQVAKQTEIKAFCEKAVADGKLLPFVRDAIFPKDKPALLCFSDDAESVPLLPFEVFSDFVSKVQKIDFTERGADDKTPPRDESKTPGEIVDEKAKALVASKAAKNYSEAIKQVLTADPELASEYAADNGKPINV